jgi:hypothetical protein
MGGIMIEKNDLLCCADAFMALTGIPHDKTLSYRMFGDSKRLTDLRGDGDITVSRFNNAMRWLVQHWPEGAARPAVLGRYEPPLKEDAA